MQPANVFQIASISCTANLQATLPSLVHSTRVTPEGLVLRTSADKLRPLALAARNSSLLLFRQLVDIAVTDKLLAQGRFVVSYHFLSSITNHRLVLQSATSEIAIIPSLAAPFTNGQRLFAAAS